MPGFPVHHQFPELAQTHVQTHVHQVSNAIQPSHPLLPSSLPAFNLSQHQGLFKGVSSSHQLPDRRLNVGALLWKRGVLTIGPPEKPLDSSLNYSNICVFLVYHDFKKKSPANSEPGNPLYILNDFLLCEPFKKSL